MLWPTWVTMRTIETFRRFRSSLRRPLGATTAMLIVSSVLVLTGASPAAAAVPAPTVALSVPESPLIGEQVEMSVTFSNPSPADVGFGPFADLFLPVTGADGTSGGGPDDGLSFVSATYLGAPVANQTMTLACDGSDIHPLTGLPVACPAGFRAGDAMTTMSLPFGSFTSTQPAATVSVVAQLSSFADLGHTLPVAAVAGFRFGADPLANPLVDPPIVSSPPVTASVTPSLITIEKRSNAPEAETATGANFARSWTVAVELAPGQTVTDLRVTDALPDSISYQGTTNINPVGSVTDEPAPGVHAGEDVTVTYPSVSNGANFDVDFYVPDLDAGGDPILGPLNGSSALVPNDASAVGDWTPLDPRDPPGTDNAVADPPGPLDTITARSIAAQKSVTVATDTTDTGATGPTPGDTLTWTIAVQVSDYFSFDDLELTDVAGDGQHLDTGFSPTISYNTPDGSGSAPLGAFFSHDTNGPGSPGGCASTDPGAISIGIDMSGVLAAERPSSGGTWVGNAPGGTTATVTYRTVIDSDYRCRFGGSAVNTRDDISNRVEASGTVARPGGGTASDTSSADVTIVAPTAAKTIYALNGSTSDTGPAITAGDLVTYRIRATVPLTNVLGYDITDYLPLPTFDIPSGPTPFTNLMSSGPQSPGPFTPTAWSVALGPDDTFSSTTGDVAALSTDDAGNSVTIDYPDYQAAPGTTGTIQDVLITVVANDQPFADGLLLTNQARLTSENSPSVTVSTDAIVQVTLTQPELTITKGVVATNRPSATFSPTQVGPAGVAWSAPGSAGARFSGGPLNSTTLASHAVDSNVVGLDGGDTVTFAIVVENVGSGIRGAFDVTVADTIPTGLSEPAGGWNLSVTNGIGTALSFTGTTPASVELVDPSPTVGSLTPANPTSGTNVAVITFDATLDGSVDMAELLSNLAAVSNYSGSQSGPNFVQAPIDDTATVRVASPGMAKNVVATAIGGLATTPTSLELPIGSTATYRATITVPESTTSGFSVRDTLDSGLAFVSFNSITASPALSTSVPGGFPAVLSAPAVTSSGAGVTAPGRVATFDFGTLTNANSDNATAETIEITYTVVLLNAPTNTTGAARNNSIQARVAGANVGSAASASDVRVNEPALSVAKSVTPSVADAGDTVTFTIVVSASSATRTITAHDVALADTLPSGLNYVPASFTHVSGVVPAAMSDAGGALTSSWVTLVPGATSTFSVQAVVGDDAASGGASVTNSAAVTWSSIAGPQGSSLSPYNTLGVQRTGSSTDVGGAANTYSRTGTASVTVNQSQIAKSLTSSSSTATNGANVTIGETATFSLAVTVPDGNLGDVTVTDLLPAGLTYVPGSATLDRGSFAGTWTGSPTLPAAQTSGNNISFVFEDMAVASGPGAADNSFTIELTARVTDVGSNTAGATLANTARVTVAGTQFNSSPVTLTVVVPHLTLTKTFAPDEAAANDSVTVTLGLTNDGTSPAFDATVSDLVDGDVFTNVSPTAPVGWTVTAVPSGGDTLVTWTADSATVLASSGSQSFSFTATLVGDVAAPSTQTNTANASATTLAGPSVHERTVTATGSDSLDVTGVDIEVVKTADVVTADAGDRITYTLTVRNLGGRDADDVVLTDTLGDDVAFVSATGSYGTTGSVITWDPFDLGAGASTTRTVVVDVDNPLPNGASTTVNAAEAHDDGSHGADLDPTNNEDQATVLLGSVVDLAIDKSGPATADAGDTVSYDVVVASVGDRNADDATVTDTLGADLTFVSATGGGTYDPMTRTVTWTGVDLSGASGSTPSVRFVVVATIADPLAAGRLRVVNDAAVSHSDDVNPLNDSDSVTTQVDAVVDLVVTKDDGERRVVPGQALTFDISVTNDGTRGASGVRVSDALDPNHVFVSATRGGTYDARTHTVSWSLGTVEVGDVVDLEVAVTVADPLSPRTTTSIANTATVTDDGANGPERDPSNNTATDTDVTGADLVVAKELSGDGLVPGASGTYTITVRNDGPMTVADLSINDTMPTSFALADATVDRGTIDTDTWLWSGANLAPGQTATLTVVVDVNLDASGSLTNSVTVTGVDVGDPTPSNNTSTVTDPVTPEVNLALSKTLKGRLERSATATWVLVVTNNGPSRATGVVVVDTLPTGLTFAGATGVDGASWTCTNPASQTVSCALGATMEPSGTATLLITTTVAADAPAGPVVNRAQVSAAESETTAADNGAVAAGALEAIPEPGSITSKPSEATESTNPTGTLARTGATPQPLLALGALLVVVGAVMLCLRRRVTH